MNETNAAAAAHDAWFSHQVQIGLDAAEAGDVITAADVELEAEAWRANMRTKIAGSTRKPPR